MTTVHPCHVVNTRPLYDGQKIQTMSETIEAAHHSQPKTRPILFSTEMVRAILDGRKTQTRRRIKHVPTGTARIWHDGAEWNIENAAGSLWLGALNCPYGKRGDRLYVRETWALAQYDFDHIADVYIYLADFGMDPVYWNWKPSIYMPRAAARLILEITDIRAERLQDICEDDAIAEGVEKIAGKETYRNYCNESSDFLLAQSSYESLWEKINGPGNWDSNPWVWVITFQKIEK